MLDIEYKLKGIGLGSNIHRDIEVMSLRLNHKGNVFKMYSFSVITIKANKENSNNLIAGLKEAEAGRENKMAA